MTTTEEAEPRPRRWTRRDWLKTGAIAAAAGATGAAGFAAEQELARQLRGPGIPVGEIREDLRYTKFPTAQWWESLVGQPVRVTDFQEWQGATAVWRGEFQNGNWFPGTGFPVLVIRVKRDDAVSSAPSNVALPPGYSLYYDDSVRNIRIVVVYDRCTHLCCYPGWQVVHDPPPSRDYLVPAPTYQVYGLDPIYCVCHGSQYDPLVLVRNVNDRNRVEYIGPSPVYGPATRAIPVVPVRAVSDVLEGGMIDPAWYVYC